MRAGNFQRVGQQEIGIRRAEWYMASVVNMNAIWSGPTRVEM